MKTRASTSTRLSRADGFTIIELLVVVSFIAILAAIALPRFSGVRALAFDASMKSDLQNAMKSEEAWYADNGAYVAFTITDGGSVGSPEVSASSGADLVGTLTESGIRIVASHDGSDRSWCISTDSSRVVEGTTC